jgi:hypothetical protein
MKVVEGKGLKEEVKLLYFDFMQVILDFQLREHEKFLLDFTKIFQ